MGQMLAITDVLLMTEEEGNAVTGLDGAGVQARHILSRPGARTQWVIIKQGAAGALLASRAKDRVSVYHQGALEVEINDTVGCGDSFGAAVVLGFIRGHSIETTLALANAVGAATAMRQGAGRQVADAPTVRRLLESELPNMSFGNALQVLESSLDLA